MSDLPQEYSGRENKQPTFQDAFNQQASYIGGYSGGSSYQGGGYGTNSYQSFDDSLQYHGRATSSFSRQAQTPSYGQRASAMATPVTPAFVAAEQNGVTYQRQVMNHMNTRHDRRVNMERNKQNKVQQEMEYFRGLVRAYRNRVSVRALGLDLELAFFYEESNIGLFI